jgi:hypothetical protein
VFVNIFRSRFGPLWVRAMSYDFVLFRAQAGVDPREVARADDAPETGLRDPTKEALKRKVGDALRAHDPALDEHVFDYEAISALYKMRVDEAYERFRYLELSDVAEGGSGAQITLFDDCASMTIPYWHEGGSARRHLQRAWDYLDIVCRETGYEVFDPQLDRVIDSGAFEDVLSSYARATARVRGIGAPVVRRRAWWKFW